MNLPRPVPTTKVVALAALGLILAIGGAVHPTFLRAVVALDLALLALVCLDFFLAPGPSRLSASREISDVLSSGVPNPVTLVLEARPPARLRGEIRDLPPPGVKSEGHRMRFRLSATRPETTCRYLVDPPTRGDLSFGDLHVRLLGPFGLCGKQVRVPAERTVKVYPDLTALSKDALLLARAEQRPSERTVRRAAEGRELDSLREYRVGDDYRHVDWKATARRGSPVVKVHRPERNQSVLLFCDCGRQMAGTVQGRRKLDHAVDAALQLARVSLDQGDAVGVLAFAREVTQQLPPRRGKPQLRAITEALYRAEATLTESDYGRAFEQAFARHHRRALVVLLTDLVDRDSCARLVRHVLALRPRHLPLVISLLDEEVLRCAREAPRGTSEAYVREVACRVEADYQRTAAVLRDRGAFVIRERAEALSTSAIDAYLAIKSRGLL